MKRKIKIFLGLLMLSTCSYAQKDVVNEEINITKEKQIEVQKADRIFDKIPAVNTQEKQEKKLDYSFIDRKPTGVEAIEFSPNIVNPTVNQKDDNATESYNNYVKVGIGNFGRIYGEAHVNSNQDQPLVWGVTALHNSTKRGPIDNVNSGTGLDKIRLDGKYTLTSNEVKMNVGYERRNYYFYGYDTTVHKDYKKADLRETLNLFSIGANFENISSNPLIDYTVSTQLRTLKDYYYASETDWGTKIHAYMAIVPEKFFALLDGEAYITQRSDNYVDNPTRKRNLFRVEPSFRWDNGVISAKVGFRAVNEYDQIRKINNTKGYPIASISYKTPSLIYFFAGFDADIIRNTLHSFYDENPYLVEQIDLQNTYKNRDFYIGSRSDFTGGFSYNLKISYGQYKNLYYFTKYNGVSLSKNDIPVSVTKFEAVYDTDALNFANPSLEVGYTNFDFWKSNIKADYYYYENKKFAKPFGRPNFVGRWGNTFSATDKIIANLDFNFIGGLYAKDPDISEPVKMKNIADLNAGVTYLFSKQFSTFVKLNNIIGKNYQQYYNYPVLGLNFLVGLNMTF